MGEITVSVQLLLGLLGTIITLLLVGPLAFIGREAIKDLRELEKNHDTLAQNLPLEYVRRDDYKADMTEIKGILHQIYDKLDAKQDKRHGE